MWYGSAKHVGQHHLKIRSACQDEVAAFRAQTCACVVVSDGTGSSPHGGIGARLAVQTVHVVLEACLTSNDGPAAESCIRNAFSAAFLALNDLAEREGRPNDDYLTTLTVGVLGDGFVSWGHVGDGALIAADSLGGAVKLTEEQEDATGFGVVPLQAGPQRWEFGCSSGNYTGVLAVSDGLREAFQPDLLDGCLYERLCLYALGAGDEGIGKLVSLVPTTDCQLFDTWARLAKAGLKYALPVLQDDLSIAVAADEEAIGKLALPEEPGWPTLVREHEDVEEWM